MRKNNLLLWLLIVSNLLTYRIFSQNENKIKDKETIPEINNKKTFIISSHHLSLKNIAVLINTIKKPSDIFSIINALAKFNSECTFYERFYLRTYFFNNIQYFNIPKQKEDAKTQENSSLNTSKISTSVENEKNFYVHEILSVTIGKKIFYGGSNNMFSLETGFYIGFSNNNEESLIHKIISKFIIILNLYRRTFKNNIYISFGHIFINPCSIYDFLKYREKEGSILYDLILLFFINMVSFNFGYDFPYDT